MSCFDLSHTDICSKGTNFCSKKFGMVEMHHTPDSDIHLKVVSSWEKKNVHGLTTDEQLRLFVKALKAIEKRTLRTFSHVTLYVILDRVVKEAKAKFPHLSVVKVEPTGLNISGLASYKNGESQELLEGFRFLVVELLEVLGNITADILTGPLHKELLQVTWKKNQRRTDEYPIN